MEPNAPPMLTEFGDVANLIPISIGTRATTIDTRDLYAYLEVGTPYGKWAQRRLEELDAVEGRDFWTRLSESTGGRPQTLYLVSLGIAKEMAMLERNEKGREVRRYFIAAEDRMREMRGKALNVPRDPLTLFRYALEAIEQSREENEQFRAEIATVKESHAQLESRFDDQPISAHADKRNTIFNLVHELGNALGGTYQIGLSWRRFKLHFNLSKYDALPVHRYDEAVALLRQWIADAQRDTKGLYN